VLPEAGAEWMWRALQDRLLDARIVVLNGDKSASAGLDGPPVVDGREITLSATFHEDQAVFEWSAREVQTATGVVLDRQEGDFGRKPASAVWVVDAVIELGAGE
jgi:hypothetical protein